MLIPRCLLVAGLVYLLSACSSNPERERAIGEAYVGPAKLTLRKELSQRSDIAAELKHGDRLELLAVRRRFFKVRNMGGAEGWLDGRNLLSGEQMRELESLIERASKLPSQGKATVYDALNVHTEANRYSPSPFQIPPGGSVEVLEHAVAPRNTYQPTLPNLITVPKAAPKKTKPRRKKKAAAEEEAKKDAEIPPPPMPPAPKLPENWRELSRTDLEAAKEASKLDDWTLVRLENKSAGWVLTRMLTMALPDEVAQYANGKRITSYLKLQDVDDEGARKGHWLMTTVSEPYQQHDFDHFRVFIWNLKRHRYETAYAARDFKGYYPVATQTVEFTEGKQKISAPGFTAFIEDENGNRWKNTYALYGLRVRMVNKEPARKPQPAESTKLTPTATPTPAADPAGRGLITRIRDLFR